MSRFWSPIVATLAPYVAGEQSVVPGLIKLNTNESPYGPSPRALAAIAREATDGLRLYPDPTCFRLRAVVAETHGIDADQVFVGNGFWSGISPSRGLKIICASPLAPMETVIDW